VTRAGCPGRGREPKDGRRCGSGRSAAAMPAPAREAVSTRRAPRRDGGRLRAAVLRWSRAGGGRPGRRHCREDRPAWTKGVPRGRAAVRCRGAAGAGRGDTALFPERRVRWGRSWAVWAGWPPEMTPPGRIRGRHSVAAGAGPERAEAARRCRIQGGAAPAARAGRRWPRPDGIGRVPGRRRALLGPGRRRATVRGGGSAPRRRWVSGRAQARRRVSGRAEARRLAAARRCRIRGGQSAAAGVARGQMTAPSRSRIRWRRRPSSAGAWRRPRRVASGGRCLPPLTVPSPLPETGRRRWKDGGRGEPAARTALPGRWPQEPTEARHRWCALVRTPRVPWARSGLAGSRGRRCRQAVRVTRHLAPGGPPAPGGCPLPLSYRSRPLPLQVPRLQCTGWRSMAARRRALSAQPTPLDGKWALRPARNGTIRSDAPREPDTSAPPADRAGRADGVREDHRRNGTGGSPGPALLGR
jgi:hypothetical protein